MTRHHINPPRAVYHQFGRLINKTLLDDIGFRRADLPEKIPGRVQFHQTVVVGVGHVNMAFFRHKDPAGVVKPVGDAVVLKPVDHPDQFPTVIGDNNPPVPRIKDIDFTVLTDKNIRRGSQVPNPQVFPGNYTVWQVSGGGIDDITPIIIRVTMVG